MSDGEQQDCGLPEESGPDPAPRRTPQRQSRDFGGLLASGSKCAVLAFLMLAVVMALPLLAYTRRERLPLAEHERQKQISLALHPERHISRGPATLIFNWTVTLGTRAPDGVEKQVYLVNGTSRLIRIRCACPFDSCGTKASSPALRSKLVPETESLCIFSTGSSPKASPCTGTAYR